MFDAKVYPIQAPNGSTVIIYGHETGIRILWRGGRRIKSYKEPENDADDQATKSNNASDDVIMIIDSDEEDSAPTGQIEVIPTVEYEDEEDEIEPRSPFQNIIRDFDISLGVKVMRISIPSILPDAIRSADSVSPVLSNMIIVAASGADSSVHIVTVPLTPPPPPNSPYLWDFQTLAIPALNIQSVPAAVSMTVTCEETGKTGESEGRSLSKQDASPESSGQWKLLLAIHSTEAAGKLSLYQLQFDRQPIQAPYSYKLSSDNLLPEQQVYLLSPAKSVTFHPSQYPSDRHGHLLLVFENGSVDLYSLLPSKSQSAPTPDRRRSKAKEQNGINAKRYFTLYTDFDQSSENCLRKRIVDAKWVLGGRAVMALTTDGEWGLWDIDGSGPDQAHQLNVVTLPASQLSSFVLTGRVSSSEVSSRTQTTHSASKVGQAKTKFAPMTPSTRRIREEALFKGAPQRPLVSSHSYRGGISVVPANQGWDKPVDESILIWHEDKNVEIPSLLSLWKNSNKPAETVFESSTKYKPRSIENINLLGELEKGVCYIPAHFRPAAGQSKDDSSRPDILITAETRLLILATKLQLPEEEEVEEEIMEQNAADEQDQQMLEHGELGLEGMDRMLASMARCPLVDRPNLLRSSQNTFFT